MTYQTYIKDSILLYHDTLKNRRYIRVGGFLISHINQISCTVEF